MSNQDKSNLLRELMLANGMPDDLLDSLMQHGDKLMEAIGLTEEHLAASIRQTSRQEAEAITQDSVMNMNDNELVNSIGCRLDIKSQNEELLSDVEATVLTLSLLDMEVMNGGLCQFIVNPSGRFLQQVPDALRSVGADEYADAFCRFADANKLDLKELSNYYQNGIDADFSSFYTLLEKYPFSDFDDRYVELYKVYPLESKIAAYIKAHAAEFEEV